MKPVAWGQRMSVSLLAIATAIVAVLPFDFASATTLYLQPEHDQVAYTGATSTNDRMYWTTLHPVLSGGASPLYWWLYGILPHNDETSFRFNEAGVPVFCTIRFAQTTTIGWMRSYALPSCTFQNNRIDPPAYVAGTTLNVSWLGDVGTDGRLYGGGAAGSSTCTNNNISTPCTAQPALFVTDDPDAVPEPDAPLPYNDDATHIVGGDYYGGYHFSKEGSPYVIDGSVSFRTGNVTLDPGIIIKFRNQASGFSVNDGSVLVNLATAEEPVYFTSYRDDVHGGDTNGDGDTTLPAPGDWRSAQFGCTPREYDNLHFLYGGHSLSAAGDTGVVVACAQGNSSNEFRFDNMEAAHSMGGLSLQVSGGGMALVANSSFHNNVLFGVRTLIPQFQSGSSNLVSNWWGSERGPRSADNPGGDGDRVIGPGATVPFLTTDPFADPPPVAAAPTVTNLAQFREFGVDPIDPGAGFIGNAVVLKADIVDPDSASVRLEVELKPADTPFDGAGTVSTTSAVVLGAISTLAVDIAELISPDDQYAGRNHQAFHWRARITDAEGHVSEWQEYSPGTASFTSNVVPLWTQVRSGFPSEALSDVWARAPYASGRDSQCSRNDPNRATIATCGCAITSLIMYAKYFDIQKDIENIVSNPLTFNDWLSAHGGYTPQNTIYWPAAESYFGYREGGVAYQTIKLDDAHFKTTDRGIVNGYLTNLTPVIVYQGSVGHYTVLDSALSTPSGPTYTLRDPRWYNTHTLADADNRPGFVRDYRNTFTHATPFKKLAAAEPLRKRAALFLNSPAELLVTNAQGQRAGRDPETGILYEEIPGSRYVVEDPIVSSEEDISPADFHHPKVLYLRDIADGAYSIQVIGTGEGSYTLESLFTDEQGTTTTEVFAASTSPNVSTEYELTVTETGADIRFTADELIDLLKTTIRQSDIRPGIKTALFAQAVAIEKTHARGQDKAAKAIVLALEKEITVLKKRNAIPAATAEKLLAILADLKKAL